MSQGFIGIAISTGLLGLMVLMFKVSAWHGAVKRDRYWDSRLMDDVGDDRNVIHYENRFLCNDLNSILARLPSLSTTSNSKPIHLTDIGERISNDINAK